ncbi:LOW QUALITY PROTEIN: uncharacterized protein [Argopecten irradians]|uniref:LOW QUALITY PROTEIN: uncharacterized protein n=1 Tax=Argopecten irradians TaxID=31199 RepID=UPI00371061C9
MLPDPTELIQPDPTDVDTTSQILQMLTQTSQILQMLTPTSQILQMLTPTSQILQMLTTDVDTIQPDPTDVDTTSQILQMLTPSSQILQMLTQTSQTTDVTPARSYRYVDTNQPDPTDVDTNQPDPTDVDTNQPDPTDFDTNQPDPQDVDTNQPDPTDVDTNQPNPTDVDTNQPDPTDVDTNQPDPTDVDTNQPDPTDVDTNQPDPTDVDTNQPNPTDPDPTDVDINQLNPADVVINQSKPPDVDTNQPDPPDFVKTSSCPDMSQTSCSYINQKSFSLIEQSSDSEDFSDFDQPLFPELEMDQASDDESFFDGDSDADPDFVLTTSELESDVIDDSDDDTMSTIIPFTALHNTKIQKKDPSSNGLLVQNSNNKDGVRVWDKKHFCLYCHEGYTNITKHYFGPHKNETEVQRILSYPVKSEERRLGLLKLRNSGDYHHNTDVLKTGSGIFVTWTRNEDNKLSPEDYLPCEDCLGFFLKSNLWRHRRVCSLRKNDTHMKHLRSEANLLLPASVDVCDALQKKVIGHMKADKVTQVVRNDATIIRLGEKLFQKHGHLPHLFVYVSQKMRELGRFLLSAREVDTDINSLADVLKPEKFPTVLKSTRHLCGYSCSENKFSNPSLALKIGHLLKKCAMIQKANALMTEDTSLGSKSDAFLSLCEMEWTDSVSGMALQTLSTAKMNKGQLLPLTEDIKKVQEYLKEKSSNLTESLKKTFTKETWNTLNQVTLARLVLFNRRRGGEAERITLKDYQERQKSGSCLKDIEESLSPMEKALCSTFERVEIRGKRGRIVPVLLTTTLQKSIECLMKYRDAAGVHVDNKYVFPRSSFDSLNPIRSADCLRRFGREAKLTVPENLTSTQLRKHVATVSQVLNLTKNDLENIAGFFRHDIAVHRSFYRLPQETLQVARMGRLLTAFDNGDVARYSGKSIEEIQVDEDLELDDQPEGGDELLHGIELEQSESSDNDMENHPIDANPNPLKRSNQTEGSCSAKRSKSAKESSLSERSHHSTRKGQIKLNKSQEECLRQVFQENVKLRKELKRNECDKAIAAHSCLKKLEWKKIKNTIHNWITREKIKTKKMMKGQEK